MDTAQSHTEGAPYVSAHITVTVVMTLQSTFFLISPIEIKLLIFIKFQMNKK